MGAALKILERNEWLVGASRGEDCRVGVGAKHPPVKGEKGLGIGDGCFARTGDAPRVGRVDPTPHKRGTTGLGCWENEGLVGAEHFQSRTHVTWVQL